MDRPRWEVQRAADGKFKYRRRGVDETLPGAHTAVPPTLRGRRQRKAPVAVVHKKLRSTGGQDKAIDVPGMWRAASERWAPTR